MEPADGAAGAEAQVGVEMQERLAVADDLLAQAQAAAVRSQA